MDEKKFEFTGEELANIHNALITLRPTGEEIITVYNLIMLCRQKLGIATVPAGAETPQNEEE